MDSDADQNLDRYVRQYRFRGLGIEGQRKLAASRASIVGCGALGATLASTLVRAGVGFVRLIDRDFLELNNLQRQILYDEADVASGLPKAVIATEKLRRVNSQIEIEPVVADLDSSSVERLCGDVDCILDGTDNFETRFLINDFAHSKSIPWVYGGCLEAEGQTMSILPGETPCLRCVTPEPPPAGSAPTCDTAGILAPIVHTIASIQSAEAIKILSGNRESVQRGLIVLDLWENRMRSIKLDKPDPACPACGKKELPWLSGQRGSQSAILCGRNAVQLAPTGQGRIDLPTLAEGWKSLGEVQQNPFLARLSVHPHVITVFGDGRAIIGGTDDIGVARSLYARYVGG